MKNIKNPKRIIIFAAIILVIIGISVAAALILSQQQSSGPSKVGDENVPQQSGKPERKPSEKKADSADKLAVEGKVDEGVKELDDAIRNTDNNEDKFVYQSRKATLLYNNGDASSALAPAIEAFKLNETSDGAAFVGQLALENGDKVTAREYYQKAIQRINPTSPFSDEDKEHYEGIIAGLGAE